MAITIKDIVDYFNNPDLLLYGWTNDPYDIPFDISPTKFLKFAKNDLESKIEHKYVNALSNAKRALDGQVKCLLDIFSLLKISEKKNWGFPSKIEALKKIGILAPNVLKKINRSRNLLEHEFTNPKVDEVEDFIDIVELFIESTQRYFGWYLVTIETRWMTDKKVRINLKKAEDRFEVKVFYKRNDKNDNLEPIIIVIEPDADDFFKLLTIYHNFLVYWVF